MLISDWFAVYLGELDYRNIIIAIKQGKLQKYNNYDKAILRIFLFIHCFRAFLTARTLTTVNPTQFLGFG